MHRLMQRSELIPLIKKVATNLLVNFVSVLFTFVIQAGNAHIHLHEHRFKPPFIGIVSSSRIIVSLYFIIF
jgi:hypothetical protein